MAGPGLGRGQGRPLRVVYWGTYDVGKPRNRIMLRGLRDSGVAVTECHVELWRRVEDKSQLTGPLRRAAVVARWLVSYPVLIARYLLAPAHDAVVVGYVGHVDVLVLWPFARLRRAPIVWDAFLSLYDTVVCDRRLVSPRHPVARALFRLEALACRLADRVVLDTRAHADYFQRTFHVPAERLAVVPVGAEGERFPRRSVETIAAPAAPAMTVLFYGQFIPLHGIEAIIRAADLARDDAIDWVLIGRGQEAVRIRRLLAARPIPRLSWLAWLDYDALVNEIHRADICLGIFGDTDKAARVIPNKVYQVLATGTPLVTRDSPAIRELLSPDTPGIWLVPPADPGALLAALREFATARQQLRARPLFAELQDTITPRRVGHRLTGIIAEVVAGRARSRRPAATDGIIHEPQRHPD